MCKNYDNHYIKPSEYWIEQWKEEYEGRYSVGPTYKAPAVYQEDGKTLMELFEFGLIPKWAKPDDKTTWQWKYFNARDDKLLDSERLWTPCFKSRRCIIPANGFYEPHKYGKKIEVYGSDKSTNSIPFYFSLKSTEVFGMAGIWNEWMNKETGELIKSFAIITTGPNQLIKKIHNGRPRTPLILHENDYDMWLEQVDKPEDLYDAGMFEPWADDDMQAWQVHKGLDFGKNDQEIIQPVEKPISINGGQQGSFL